ncbi:MAG: DEAD/DEAH box helicase [Parachlamydiaceae bacterium]|nr:DEAD/DEAH box helicase [Parachlamydiaceae bacterium]
MNTKSTSEILSLLKKTMKTVEDKIHPEASCILLKDRVAEFSLSSKEILASVYENDSQTSCHSVSLDFTKYNLKSTCSCSKKNMCIHIASTILYGIDYFNYPKISQNILSDIKSEKVSPDRNLKEKSSFQVTSSPGTLNQLHESIHPTKPQPSQLTQSQLREPTKIIGDKISDAKVNSWISKLEKPSVEQEIIKKENDRRNFLAYYLYFGLDGLLSVSVYFIKLSKNQHACTRANGLQLDLLNPGNNFFQTVKPFLNDEEWEIVAILMQKGSFSDEKSKKYSLTFPGSVHLLQLLAKTGRCYFDSHGLKTLRWGNPIPAQFDWFLVEGTEFQMLNLSFDIEGPTLLKKSDPICYYVHSTSTIGLVKLEEAPHLINYLLSAPPVKNEDVNMVKKALTKKIPSIAEKLNPLEKFEILDVSPKAHLKLHCFKNIYDDEFIGADINLQYGDYAKRLDLTGIKARSKPSFLVKQASTEKTIKVLRKFSQELEFVNFFLNGKGWREESKSPKRADFICDGYDYDDDDEDYDDYNVWSLDDDDDEDYDDETSLMERAEHILTVEVPLLEKNGWTVTIDPSFPLSGVYHGDEWYCDNGEQEVSFTNDWFDISLGVLINGERINMLPMLKKFVEMLSEKKMWKEFDSMESDETISLMTTDRKIIKVPVERIRNIAQHLMVEFSAGGSTEKLKISRWNAAFLEEFVQGETAAKGRWMGSEALEKYAQNIRDSASAPLEEPSPNLLCELRPYQKEGYNWMQFLRRSGMNGILADDMGLGKTVQTLAHLIQEKESGRMTLPAMIIAPTSLMPNWFNEITRFAPSLKALVLHGEERKSLFGKINEHDIILTTYPLLMRDKEFLLQHEFYILVLDEAQTIKNHKTQAYQVLQQVRTRYRICLSGTPMENHLGELWSLFHFLLPGYLGDHKTFQTIYRKPIEKDSSKARRESLFKRIKPFILRRTKQQVALDLPEKTEIIQRIEFKSKQRDLYEAIRIKAQAQLMRQINEKGLGGSQIAILDALLKLRQVCCDSRLVKFDGKESVMESAKLDCLKEMLSQMLEEGRKILIFSQFTSMLSLIEEELVKEKISYTILTGNTKDRATPVKKFQDGDVDVMLISLKAGGVGLNLTAADTVIHYDPWWNPAVESQATDRAHRMGQKKAVFVYKLVVNGSIEEKILVLQERKKNMVSSLLDSSDTTNAQITLDDLEMIFQPLPAPI